MKRVNKEFVELAGKVDCLHSGDPVYTSYVSNQFCRGAEAAKHRLKDEQSDLWIPNSLSPTKLEHTFKIALKKPSFFSLTLFLSLSPNSHCS